MKRTMFFVIGLATALSVISCGQQKSMSRELASEINADARIDTVCVRAERLVADGLNAGDGYSEVWIRDLNTFITVACKVTDTDILKDALTKFFLFQGEDGNIDDGYVPARPGMTGYDYKFTDNAPGFAAHKNTVETDQETSLVQAVYKYVKETGDTGFLDETIVGKTVIDRMDACLHFLLDERFVPEYGLLWGATTADWGDVQPEHPWGVALDENSHLCIDIYDQAMFLIAIDNFLELAGEDSRNHAFWEKTAADVRTSVRKHLWDAEHCKYRPHIYLKDSPFPAELDEDAIHYHGGSAVAIAAGLNTPEEVLAIYRQQEANRIAANAATIGLTVYPPYPEGTFLNAGLGPYSYQNGGDWTWFGARMVSALIEYGYYEEAYRSLEPMLQRVIDRNGFFEWWTPSNEPKGSGMFRGSAGVLWTACRQLRDISGNKAAR